ncbi:winged-helix DNA-binding transcription factor family protein [Actinidia rufa]|uniref:Winged-helix DNA-binding transcription factor family protein n=1 Tax=Actinidia rufa TaxID=165716 RepID=A0A7J0E3B1_9ERIC|nr:winged-helix DNA-binding transcription factor family protein [Actinidia rufa]
MMAANSNPPRNSAGGGGGDALNSTQSKPGAAARGVVSPWKQVVRGGAGAGTESESIVSLSAPSSPLSSVSAQGQISNSASDDSAADDNGSGSTNAAKKQAWNKPSNGVVEVEPVMGAVSWPALSESTRASPKSAPSDSMKDGSVLVSQKQVITDNANPSLAPNHATLTSQKSMKSSGGSASESVTANGGLSQPVPTPALVVEIPSNNAGKPGSSVPETSSRDHTHKEGGQRGGYGSQSHGGNDQIQHRNSYRRGYGTPHPRGDGSYHHNYGGRREQDHGNHGRNSHRSFNGRDAHVQPQRVGPRGFMGPPPHSSTPFIPPQVAMRPYGNPMVYPEVAPMMYVQAPDSHRGVSMVAPMQPMFYPFPDPHLPTKIMNQIDYYFSNENLIKDTFLRQNMDENGWVPIELIASFKKVMDLTTNIQLILDAMRSSKVVEVEVEMQVGLVPFPRGKLRKRDDWRRWIIVPSVQFSTIPSPQSLGSSSHDAFATELQSLSLEKTNKQGRDEAFLGRSLSGDLNRQSKVTTGEGTSQAAVQAGSNHSTSARSST